MSAVQISSCFGTVDTPDSQASSKFRAPDDDNTLVADQEYIVTFEQTVDQSAIEQVAR